MPSPSRRTVLASAGAVLAHPLAGCLGDVPDGGPATPEYDCSRARRPPPATPSYEDTNVTEPAAYPTRPDSLADEDRVVEYVEAYERAYRRNALVASHPETLRDVGVATGGGTAHDAPEGAAIVALEYTYYYNVVESDGGVVHADSPTTRASYYVDDAVVLRASDEGPRDDESALDPDPTTEGAPVECFDDG